MPIQSSILVILVFVTLLVTAPLALGLLCRKLIGSLPPASPMWLPIAQLLTALGWAAALALGKTGVMSYPASVLLGAVLYGPGLFLWGFHARRAAAA